MLREHIGTNMENAAYPEGICAGAALSAMTAAGGRTLKSSHRRPCGRCHHRPCGGCRQKIVEFADQETRIECQEADGSIKTFTIADLLPGNFGAEDLT